MYSFKQEIILKLKGADSLGAEVYPIKQEIILKLKEADRLAPRRISSNRKNF